MSFVRLLAVLLLSVAAAAGALRIAFDPSMEVWFLDKDPDVRTYREFLSIFESDQLVVVAWEDDKLWTKEGLAFVREAGERARALPHVLDVKTITHVTEAVAEPGVLSVRPLYDPEAPPDPLALRERLLGDPFFQGRLVSADGRVTAVVMTVEPLNDQAQAKIEYVSALRALTKELEAARGVEMHIAGTPVLDAAFLEYTQRDMVTNFPLILVAIVVVVIALFRTPWALLLPLSVVATAALWVAGLMGWFGMKMTVIHSVIFPMLLGMGIANSMHILSRTMIHRSEGMDREEAGRKALALLLPPSALTAFTSALGLLSLTTTSLKPLRHLGILGAVGVVAAFFLTFTLGPWLLRFLPEQTRKLELDGGTEAGGAWRVWDSALVRLARWVQARPWKVVIGGLVIVAVAVTGTTRLTMGINALNYFKDDDPVRQDVAFIDEHLAGTISIEVLVRTPGPDGLKNPEVLRSMERVQQYFEGKPGVGHVISVVDYLKELRRLVRGGAEEERKLPETQAEVSQLLLLLDDPGEIGRLADFEWKHGRVSAQVRATQIPLLVTGMPDIDERSAEAFVLPATGTTTGITKLVRNMETYLLSSQVRSLGTAFLTVLLTMVVALRSIRLGLFAMIPNIVPITLVLGLMGWTGIALDPGTAMTGAVAMGLVVDDTVHFLHHLRERLLAGDSVAVATERTLVEAGRAAAMSAVILSCAFFASCTASFKPNIYFGLLSGITILLAAAAELILLPAVLMIVPERLLKLRKD